MGKTGESRPLLSATPEGTVSLPEVHGSVGVPAGAGFWRKMFAFAGPGYLVAVGYMDPGNWATDIAGGARYGYALLSVVFLSNLVAILLQSLAARLGIASGRDLAQACRDRFPRRATFMLWVLAEVAIAATDLAEVIGSAIALNLLFGLPMLFGVCLTSLDVLIVLYLQHRRFRYVEALVVLLIVGIAGAFALELYFSKPDLLGVARGLIPTGRLLSDPTMLYLAIGILGATVMPHNLYLHSSIVQTRKYGDSQESRREAASFAVIDSTVALSSALFINGAILVVSAATFHGTGYDHVADISDAYKLPRAAARHDAGVHLVRARPAVLGPERDAHRDAGRADRDGRFPEPAASAVAAAPGHAAGRHHPGPGDGGALRGPGHRRLADSQPGRAEPPAALRHLPARAVRRRSPNDGVDGGRAAGQGPGLANRRGDRPAQHLAPVPDGGGVVLKCKMQSAECKVQRVQSAACRMQGAPREAVALGLPCTR